MESWKKLFTYFDKATCDTEKKPIIQITRRSVHKIVRDIIDQLIKVDKTAEASKLFFMPWDFELKSFVGDTANRAKYIKEQLTNEIDVKIDALQEIMEEKNKALVELIQVKFSEVLSNVPGMSYAAKAASGVQKVGAPQGLEAR